MADSAAPGPIRFIRYCYMPNRLGYCGGQDNSALLQYGLAGVADSGLTPLLQRFGGAMPYLQLIARGNAIADPFDARVVEAYWLGNELLERVEVRQLHEALLDRFGERLQGRIRELILGRAPAGARPHHSFQVLDMHARVRGLMNDVHTLDSCQVTAARVLEVIGPELLVERQPLEVQSGELAFGEARQERCLRQVAGGGFADAACPGDWVSIHWGWVCEVLTEEQRANLERYTRHHLAAVAPITA